MSAVVWIRQRKWTRYLKKPIAAFSVYLQRIGETPDLIVSRPSLMLAFMGNACARPRQALMLTRRVEGFGEGLGRPHPCYHG